MASIGQFPTMINPLSQSFIPVPNTTAVNFAPTFQPMMDPFSLMTVLQTMLTSFQGFAGGVPLGGNASPGMGGPNARPMTAEQNAKAAESIMTNKAVGCPCCAGTV